MYKKIGLIILVSIYLFSPLMAVRATDARSSRYGLTNAASGTGLTAGTGSTPADSLAIEVGRIIGTLLAFLGVIFLALMITGGIIWMTAAGSPTKVATATGLIKAAIIGLVIVLAAYAITTFVADNLLAGSAGSSATVPATTSTANPAKDAALAACAKTRNDCYGTFDKAKCDADYALCVQAVNGTYQ